MTRRQLFCRCLLAESTHPFTISLYPNGYDEDVRREVLAVARAGFGSSIDDETGAWRERNELNLAHRIVAQAKLGHVLNNLRLGRGTGRIHKHGLVVRPIGERRDVAGFQRIELGSLARA